ncbi:pyridoxamine 5'-phosphate oxidase family protein [Halomicrobium urmianum]|uniref:pyridoxamine 5'-phosphate oxidase family protein n=1 Tax=Halomicrobium urmianum TaxID=1586233 RepID=UPI001CDA1B0E|nr:pyridoxamine 5'-phosphate oxidase family protein [Halomicrobium urmianum]
MSREIGTELDDYETEEFLRNRGLGVLGFARDGQAYTIPIAFAYDDSDGRCVFRFLMGENSRKREFVAATDVASLTTYEWRKRDDWKSVVVRGPLRRVPDDDLAEAAALFSDVGEETALEVFNKPISEYETVWYELDVRELTARGQFPGVK